jgi:hypothetical protein
VGYISPTTRCRSVGQSAGVFRPASACWGH